MNTKERRAILATKSGWLILCIIVKETTKKFSIKEIDQNRIRTIDKTDRNFKVFESGTYKGISDIEDWIND